VVLKTLEGFKRLVLAKVMSGCDTHTSGLTNFGAIDPGPVHEQFLSSDGRPIRVPEMSLEKFCQDYHISVNIQTHLKKHGFTTAGGLLEITEVDLKEANLKIGEIGELRRALREFIYAADDTSSR
jgi:hypothetical protein